MISPERKAMPDYLALTPTDVRIKKKILWNKSIERLKEMREDQKRKIKSGPKKGRMFEV